MGEALAISVIQKDIENDMVLDEAEETEVKNMENINLQQTVIQKQEKDFQQNQEIKVEENEQESIFKFNDDPVEKVVKAKVKFSAAEIVLENVNNQ